MQGSIDWSRRRVTTLGLSGARSVVNAMGVEPVVVLPPATILDDWTVEGDALDG